MAELDTGRFAAVFAANAELDVGPDLLAALDRDLDQFAHADRIGPASALLEHDRHVDLVLR